MKLINRKNFISIICISFTLLVLVKLIWEAVIGFNDPHYAMNIFISFGMAVLITLILAIHYYLQQFPFVPVFLGQYAVTVGIVLGGIWFVGHYVPIADDAYHDMFISITIPFLICAAIYYIVFFRQIRKANALIEQMNLNDEKE